MPLPLVKKQESFLDEMYRQWKIIQKQWGAKAAKLVIVTKRAPDGRMGEYDSTSDELRVFLPALRDVSKMFGSKDISLPKLAASVMRHEMAHRQTLYKNRGLTPEETQHGAPTFENIVQTLEKEWTSPKEQKPRYYPKIITTAGALPLEMNPWKPRPLGENRLAEDELTWQMVS